MRTKCILVGVLIGIMIVALTGCLESSGTTSNSAESTAPSVYARVIESGKIRAAYITYPPAVIKDTITGDLTGTFVEVLEQVAKNLDLELEWTEEVGWGAQIEGLQADRYDIVGSPVWANPTRGKLTTMSIPVYFSGIGVYVRDGDNRFSEDGGWKSINNGNTRIVTIDGETGDLIARTDFPNAQRVSLTQLSDISEMFLNVKSNKADVLFAEPFYGYEFLKNNPGSVKNIGSANPIRTLGNCYMFKSGEFQFKHMIDVAVNDLLNSGFVDKVIDRYEPYPGTFYRVARPYRAD